MFVTCVLFHSLESLINRDILESGMQDVIYEQSFNQIYPIEIFSSKERFNFKLASRAKTFLSHKPPAAAFSGPVHDQT